jgi:hypothetical protein
MFYSIKNIRFGFGSAQAIVPVNPVCPKLVIEAHPQVGPLSPTEVYQNLLPFYCLQHKKITSIKVTECFSENIVYFIISFCKYNCIILATSILFEKIPACPPPSIAAPIS